MRKRLRVPAALTVATLGVATTVALVSVACEGDDGPTDGGGCAVYCVENFTDAGAPPPDGGCPNCAELAGGQYVCPSGCTPFG